MTSFGIMLQATESKQNERSLCVIFLCAGLLTRGMIYELKRVLQEYNGRFCNISVIYDVAILLSIS